MEKRFKQSTSTSTDTSYDKKQSKISIKRNDIFKVLFKPLKEIRNLSTELFETFCTQYPCFKIVSALINSFKVTFTEKQVETLESWIAAVRKTGIKELISFTNGIERDYETVISAIRLPYSNGLAEGSVNKIKVILAHLDGLSNRGIATKLLISKDTVNKFVNEYNKHKATLLSQDSQLDPSQLIEAIMGKPKYNVTNRKPAKVTAEIIKAIEECIESNRKKRESGRRKQEMKKCDIYEKLLDEGFDISCSTVKRLVESIDARHREAFIKQEYSSGDVCEFDWGEVKLNINNTGYKTYQLALFTSAMSNLRFWYAL